MADSAETTPTEGESFTGRDLAHELEASTEGRVQVNLGREPGPEVKINMGRAKSEADSAQEQPEVLINMGREQTAGPETTVALAWQEGSDPEAYTDAFMASLAPGVEFRNADGDSRRVEKIENGYIWLARGDAYGAAHYRLSALRESIKSRPERSAIL